MLFIEMLIKTLLITKVCQSLTIFYRPRKTMPSKSLNSTKTFKVRPQQQDSSSAVLSETSSLNFQQPGGYSNTYSDQYDHYSYNNQRTATRPKTKTNANEQPATIAVSLESEILNESKKVKGQPSSVNYNNKIYHIKSVKKASPLTNNEQEFNTKFIVRKQRNLRENHDDKLIEQNIEEIENLNENNDRQYNTKAAASLSHEDQAKDKQPSKSSHEIRYLHDIFLNYPKSHHVNFGHTELSPVLFEKRFETQKLGNRYKGEIMWLDNTGGFAQHHWDLAQGRL